MKQSCAERIDKQTSRDFRVEESESRRKEKERSYKRTEVSNQELDTSCCITILYSRFVFVCEILVNKGGTILLTCVVTRLQG